MNRSEKESNARKRKRDPRVETQTRRKKKGIKEGRRVENETTGGAILQLKKKREKGKKRDGVCTTTRWTRLFR